MMARIAAALLWCVFSFIPVTANTQDCFEPVGQWPYGVSNSVAAEGDLALLANGAALQVMDVTDPSAPAILGELHLVQPIEAVAVSGDRGYALTTTNNLHVVDLSAPTTPSEMGVLEGLNANMGLAVVGDLVCVLGYRKLLVVDAGTPSAPVLSGELEWPDVSVLDIAMASDHVFLAAGDDGLRVVDVSDPTTPSEVATVDLGADTYARYLDVVGGLAYLSGGGTFPDDKLFVVDVTDPEHPVLDADALITNGGGDIVVLGGLVHIAAYPGLHIYDVGIPKNPVWLGSATILSNYQGRLAAVDDHILVTTYFRGLTVVETVNPASPAPVSTLDAPGRIEDAAYSDGVLFIAAGDRGLRAVDVTNPSQPVELGYNHIPMAPQAFAVAVQEDLAYVSSISSLGLVAVDVSNPAAPVILGNAPGASGDWITIAGDHAYVVNGWHGWLYVVDLSTPALPVLVGSMDLPPGTGDSWEWPVVSGDHLFVRNNHNDPFVAIIDVGNPSAPTHVGNIDVNANIAGLAATDSWLFVPDLGLEDPEVRIFNIRNPASPVEHAPYAPVNGYADVIEVSGSVAYMSIFPRWTPYSNAVEAVLVADPTAPEYLGVSDKTWYPRRLLSGSDRVFSVSLETGFDSFTLCHGPLFADGFESGDTTEWASTVP